MKLKNTIATLLSMVLAVPVGSAVYALATSDSLQPVTREAGISGTSPQRGMAAVQRPVSIPRAQNLRMASPVAPMAAPGTVSEGLDLRGCNLKGTNDTHIYTVPTSQGGSFVELGDLQYVTYCGYDDGKGHFYGVNFMSLFDGLIISNNAFRYDYAEMGRWWPSTQMQMNPPYSYLATDLAYDPTSGNVYGCFYSEDGKSYEWGTVVYDYTDSKRVKISDLGQPLYGVGIDAGGQCYAVAADGSFNKVDKNTGVLTKVGDTGLSIDRVCSGCYNDVDGNFLMAYANSSGSGLAAIDPATGAARTVTRFAGNQQVTCLHVVRAAQAGGVPAAPALKVSCPDGTMNAVVELSMPTELDNGSSAAGQTFDWTIMVNGVQNCTGSAAAGETVARTIAVTEAGENTFSATVSNSEGASEPTIAKCFIGKGAPETPANVVLSVSDKTATLTWDAVTASVDGGYLDPADVTYSVYDMAGNVLAQNLKATTWTTGLDITDYVYLSYVVRAYNGEIPSMPAISNGVGLGALEVPFTMDMSDAGAFERHRVADVNGDKHTWTYRNGRTYYEFSIVNKADDWLMSPRVSLKADSYYMLRPVFSTSYDGDPEYVEIKMGSEPAVEAMSTPVAEKFAIGFEDTEHISVIHPSADGVYSIGFHAVSDAGDNFIYLKSYSLSAPMTGGAPTAVTDISVDDDPTAALKARISFKAPERSVGGEAMGGTLKVRVMRGDALVEEVSCAPGSVNTVYDTALPGIGVHTYTFIPFSAAGEEGVPAKGSGYVGPRTPKAPARVTMSQSGASSIEVKWEATTSDILGNEILPENISYDVYMLVPDGEDLVLSDKLNAQPVAGTTFVADQLEIPADQQYCYMAVKALTRGLESDPAFGFGIAGDAYQMPVVYTSQESVYQHFMAYSGGGYPAWVKSDRYKIPGQDGDNEFLITINDITTDVTLESGKVRLSDKDPVLIFYVWKLPGKTADDGTVLEDENETEVFVVDGHKTRSVAYVYNQDLEAEKWNKVCVSLADYRGKDVSVKIRALCKTYSENLYDNIRICENIPYDLEARISSAPEEKYTGETFDVTARIINNGSEDVGSYKVVLLRDGVEADVKEVKTPLAESSETTVAFTQSMTLNDGDAVEYAVRVVAEGDGDSSNDLSGVARVRRVKSAYPAPAGLRGESSGSDNRLAWNDVDVSGGFMMSMVEDVESADSWSDVLSEWTFVDVDGGDSGGFQGVVIPGHPQHSQYSFFVFDFDDLSNSEYVVSQNMRAYSGSKYLATMYRMDEGQIDDWAISPLLPGHAQTISFWARSYVGDYPETVEVWYSLKDSADPADFVKLDGFDGEDLPAEWTKYSAMLPEGAVRFALRSCATGSFMLMVDDIAYQRLNTSLRLKVNGFNVYCDGERVTEQPVSRPEFVHQGAAQVKHTYNVTAVYNYGESEYSEPLVMTPGGGVDDVAGSSASVRVNDGAIVVTGADGRQVTITRVDGVVLHRVCGDTSFQAVPGVYVVSVGCEAVKVNVK